MEMTTLDELERLLAATQGEEWRVSNQDPVRVVDGTGAYIALCDPHHKGDPLQETRAALIVAAINALPGLLDRVERLEAALKPFAEASNHLHPANSPKGLTLDGIAVKHWHAARAALKET
jgi:hypothetical protein